MNKVQLDRHIRENKMKIEENKMKIEENERKIEENERKMKENAKKVKDLGKFLLFIIFSAAISLIAFGFALWCLFFNVF